MSENLQQITTKIDLEIYIHGLWVSFWVQNWRSLKEVSCHDLSWCHYFWSTSSLQVAFSSTKLFLFILSSSSRLFLLYGTVLFRLKWGTDCLWLPKSPVHTPLLRSTCRRRHGPAPKHAAREAWHDMISPSVVAHAVEFMKMKGWRVDNLIYLVFSGREETMIVSTILSLPLCHFCWDLWDHCPIARTVAKLQGKSSERAGRDNPRLWLQAFDVFPSLWQNVDCNKAGMEIKKEQSSVPSTKSQSDIQKQTCLKCRPDITTSSEPTCRNTCMRRTWKSK